MGFVYRTPHVVGKQTNEGYRSTSDLERKIVSKQLFASSDLSTLRCFHVLETETTPEKCRKHFRDCAV